MKKKKDAKKKSLGSELQFLRKGLGFSQEEMAGRLGLTRSSISACELGRIALAPAALVTLADMSPETDQKLFFLRQAGLDEQMIKGIAEDVLQRSSEPPAFGETVRLPSYRAAELRLEKSGNDVPMPAEFVPNPASTICLRAEADSNGLLSGPRGLYIVDRSKGKSDRLRDLLHRVVVLSFVARDELLDDPSGIYVGRIWMQHGGWRDRSGVRLLHHWSLVLLSSDLTARHVQLSNEAARLPFDIPERSSRGPAFNIADLLDWLRERPEERRAFERARADLLDSARVPPGSKILGEVIGRLTGHIKESKD